MQSSTESDVSISGDISVLERQQRATFQRFYQPHQQPIHQNQAAGNPFPGMLDGNFASLWHLDDNSQNMHQRGPARGLSRSNSSVTAVVAAPATTSKLNDRNTTSGRRATGTATATRKRKAELSLEDKKWEGETGEAQSEITVKSERETSGNCTLKQNKKASKEDAEKCNYIHVRARRGQATDSHSLAERARREKISKKMKCLQDLVPGCNKVVGKAGMLDEIINYVQSLQKQVEFLSMKLATLSPRVEYSMDNLFPKEPPAFMGGFPAAAAQSEAAFLHYNPSQHLAAANSRGGSAESDISRSSSDHLHMTLQRKENNHSSVSIPEFYMDSSYFPQLQGWESEWQTPFNSSYH